MATVVIAGRCTHERSTYWPEETIFELGDDIRADYWECDSCGAITLAHGEGRASGPDWGDDNWGRDDPDYGIPRGEETDTEPFTTFYPTPGANCQHSRFLTETVTHDTAVRYDPAELLDEESDTDMERGYSVIQWWVHYCTGCQKVLSVDYC